MYECRDVANSINNLSDGGKGEATAVSRQKCRYLRMPTPYVFNVLGASDALRTLSSSKFRYARSFLEDVLVLGLLEDASIGTCQPANEKEHLQKCSCDLQYI